MKNVDRLIAPVVLAVALIAGGGNAECAELDSDFQKAYERWHAALDSQGAIADVPFFFDETVGSG